MTPSSQPHPTGITVVGTGTVPCPVDRATVTCAIEATRDDAGEAFALASEGTARLQDALTTHGVMSADIRTLDVTLGPRFDYSGSHQKLLGYQATQQIRVQTDDLTGLGSLLSTIAAAADGVRIDALALDAVGARGAGADARTAAMIDAREKAMSLAALAGRPLGEVLSVVELGDDVPAPRRFALVAHASRDASMPISAGDTEVTVSVRVHFAWAN